MKNFIVTFNSSVYGVEASNYLEAFELVFSSLKTEHDLSEFHQEENFFQAVTIISDNDFFSEEIVIETEEDYNKLLEE